jgi:hypothetical protein
MKTPPLPIAVSGAILLLALLAGGCAGVSTQIDTVLMPDKHARFEANLHSLLDELLAHQEFTPRELAPVAVMPRSLKAGTRFSRLEELVMERLVMKLRRRNDFHTLSRQNWLEFREGRPLTFLHKPPAQRRLLQNLVVYEVGVSPDQTLKQVNVHIVAMDANGHALPGVVAETVLDFGPYSLSRRLYLDNPHTNPFPEGLEEQPFTSLDRLTFSLAGELADSYRNGFSAGEQKAADQEIRVLLYPRPSSGRVSRGLVRAIQDSLQQAIVSNRGFTCVVSREDFGPAFDRIDFYRQNASIFEMKETEFTAGTIFLMADIFTHSHLDTIGVAMRAIWRASPLETTTGELIPTNVAGTYLSGFTAKAYMSYYSSRDRCRTKTAAEIAPPEKKERAFSRPVPSQPFDICFYEFTEVFEKRIYPVLTNAPGVTEIKRADHLCDTLSGCLCYELYYQASLEDISAWLRQNLRTSQVLAFWLVPKGDGRLDVYFDGGFK